MKSTGSGELLEAARVSGRDRNASLRSGRNIYNWYLELGSVSKLKTYLDAHGIKSKERTSPAGAKSGGVPFFPGALYLVLQNPIYRGEIRHRNQSYPGLHEAIIQHDLWDKVQNQLRSENGGRRNDIKANSASMLSGLLQDLGGSRFRASHTVKNGKRYRYYFSQGTGKDSSDRIKAIRLPAHDVEKQVSLRLQSFLGSPKEVIESLTFPQDHPETTQTLITAARKRAEEWSTASPSALVEFVRKMVRRVVVRPEEMDLEVSRSGVRALLNNDEPQGSDRAELPRQDATSNDLIRLGFKARLKRCGGEMRLVLSSDSGRPEIVAPIVRAIARAYAWREEVLSGTASRTVQVRTRPELKGEYLRRVLGCAFLAPDILEAILDGPLPAGLTLKKLTSRRLPLDWAEQRIQLGFPTPTCTQPSTANAYLAPGGHVPVTSSR